MVSFVFNETNLQPTALQYAYKSAAIWPENDVLPLRRSTSIATVTGKVMLVL
jgi:hypothetical protein